MWNSDYEFWLKWRAGKIKRNLTEEEYSEVRACEFAMHLLVPSAHLVQLCGGYENMQEIYSLPIYRRTIIVQKLAKVFHVPPKVVLYKMEEEIINYNSKRVEQEENKSNSMKKKKKKIK